MSDAKYSDIIKQIQNQRITITDRQRRQIALIFREASRDIGRGLGQKKVSSDSKTALLNYAKELKQQSNYIFKDIQNTIITGVTDVSMAVINNQSKYWGNIQPAIMNKVIDSMADIPQSVVNEIITGDLYKDGYGLSKSIWRARRKYEKDIDYIIQRGIIEKKPTLDLARDLETYVNPSAKKAFKWSKRYPGSTEVVDYNAQRLSRTAVTHAYQLSMQRSTAKNPFVSGYLWSASNGKGTCEICEEMDGKVFDKNNIPLDHPNGMCCVMPIVEESYDEISNDIADWLNGGSNAGLDNWLNDLNA